MNFKVKFSVNIIIMLITIYVLSFSFAGEEDFPRLLANQNAFEYTFDFNE